MTITTLITDLGGVLLTNGWGTSSRVEAAKRFNLDYKAMDDRHRLTFDTYETGKMTLDQYLDEIVFYEKRPFTREAFKEYMYSCSQPFDEMLGLMREIKSKKKIKIGIISNEGSGITEYRLNHFGLKEFVDFFVVSCFVHLKKPDHDIFKLALDIAQAQPSEVIYLEDRLLFVQTAEQLGIPSIKHNSYAETKRELEKLL